jgi:broad specificity phosphatase PhoE
MEQQWPKTLWLVRHGQSAGNVAGAAAEAASLPSIDIVTRDVDTPLSTLGEQQSRALGRWFRDLPREGQPNVLLCSPYLRARATAFLVLETAGLGKDLALFKADERLRGKGIWDPRSPDQAWDRRALSAARRAA